AGNPRPTARSSRTKNPCCVALAHVVASTAVELSVKNWTPSSDHLSVSGDTLRSRSSVYVWNCPQHEQAARPPSPVVSLHGPPGLTPQCRVPNSVCTALMLSMMSISPTLGQFVNTPRKGAPSIQKAGQ